MWIPEAIETERLVLRRFSLADAPRVALLAGEVEIAQTTLHIPHPYTVGAAESWILSQWNDMEHGLVFAITLLQAEGVIGAIGLHDINKEHHRAELGYWIGKPYWNRGYATEVGRAVIKYGFEALDLNRIYAMHFWKNPASGRVLQKIGMKHEGRLPQHVRKWEVFQDCELYGILKHEYEHPELYDTRK